MPIRIARKTIQFKAKGYARLSEDLAIAESFSFTVDRRKKQIILTAEENDSDGGDRLKLWKTNLKKSKSRMMSLTSAMAQIGLDAKTLVGKTYNVKIQDNSLILKFPEDVHG